MVFRTDPDTSRRQGLAVLAGLLAAPAARAQPAWPSRPVTLVVPFAPGGSTYFLARLLARRLSMELGQPFPLDVRIGDSGLAAIGFTAAAAADGHTLVLLPNSSFAMAPHVLPGRVDVARDLAAVGLVATNPMVLCVDADSGFRSLADLITAARAAPGRIPYSSAGIGVSNHLAVELMAQGFGVQFTHLLFPGMAPSMQAVLSDQAQFSFIDLVTAVPAIQAGTLRALAVTASQRLALLPEVPTMAEAGLPGFNFRSDFALFAPAGTPEAVLARLSASMIAIMSNDATRQLLAPLRIEPWPTTRAEFADYFKAEDARWRDLIRERNIHAP